MPADPDPRPSADSIAAAAGAAARRGPPPVHLWNPPYCGELDIRIARDGSWSYLGTPIGRPALVRLFASILKREGDRYFLVTPVEKVGIVVEDAPFLAVDFDLTDPGPNQTIAFTTSVGDRVEAGPDRPIRVAHDDPSGAPAPYVLVRPGLEARIDRKSFYRLVDIAEVRTTGGTPQFGVLSRGGFFPIGPASGLDP